jgi:muramoyltetrapeptide carboxypeptidase
MTISPVHSNRRTFLKTLGLGGLALAVRGNSISTPASPALLKPPRLKSGDSVGLVNPAGATFQSVDVTIVRESLAALGLKSVEGNHLLDRYGYLAGSDEARAKDLNGMFADPSIDAVLAVRGGWGCNRILPLLDFEGIRKHPKALIGYSDITSLLVAIYARSGVVTFHGPVGTSTWNPFSVEHFRSLLFDAEPVTYANPRAVGDLLAQTKDRVETITPGSARGRLVGGNLSVLSSMIGSEYLPSWSGVILFVEEDGELLYRIDRMLTQLKLAGVLRSIAGFVFGKCTNCTPGEGYGSLTLEEVLADHIRPLGIPAWYGAMIGHIENKFTVPLGIEAEIDASVGTIRLLESAVA